MKIRLNGVDRETAAATIASLLEELRLAPQTVLIECNRRPVQREQWPDAPLHDGDSLEILRVAAGG